MKFNFASKVINTVIITLSFISCNNSDNQTITIHRFDRDVMQYLTLDSLQKENFKQEYNSVIKNYINLIFPDTIINVDSKLESFVNSNAIKLFYPKVDSTFSNISSISSELSTLNNSLNSLFGLKLPKVYTTIIPYNQSIILTEQDILIGLNHYLGQDYPPYSDFPEYKRRFKTVERLKYDVCESFVRTTFPFESKENTFLENLIYEGTIANAIENLISNYDEKVALKFTQQQLDWCKENEYQIWNEIISTNILYSTNQEYKDSFFTPAPFTRNFSNSSPGELGKWIGKRIIQKYNEVTKTSSKYILSNKLYQDSQSFLINSQYNGK